MKKEIEINIYESLGISNNTLVVSTTHDCKTVLFF